MSYSPMSSLRFRFDRVHRLVRSANPAHEHQKPYSHICTLQIFEKVCWAIEEQAGEPISITALKAASADYLPYTQVSVALQFLEERGILKIEGRLRWPTTSNVHLDGMIEWYALDHYQTIGDTAALVLAGHSDLAEAIGAEQ